jgi:hypothetical protein
MKNNDDIPTIDATEIKQLINHAKQGKLDQGDALLIEKLLNILLVIVSLLGELSTSCLDLLMIKIQTARLKLRPNPRIQLSR